MLLGSDKTSYQGMEASFEEVLPSLLCAHTGHLVHSWVVPDGSDARIHSRGRLIECEVSNNEAQDSPPCENRPAIVKPPAAQSVEQFLVYLGEWQLSDVVGEEPGKRSGMFIRYGGH